MLFLTCNDEVYLLLKAPNKLPSASVTGYIMIGIQLVPCATTVTGVGIFDVRKKAIYTLNIGNGVIIKGVERRNEQLRIEINGQQMIGTVQVNL